jgi:hypothetical protein
MYQSCALIDFDVFKGHENAGLCTDAIQRPIIYEISPRGLCHNHKETSACLKYLKYLGT